MQIEMNLQSEAIDSTQVRGSLPELPECGGYASFEGLIRNVNHGRQVTHLEYEAYETLALKELSLIGQEAGEKFGVPYIRVIHRTGRLEIGDVAVVIQVLAGHRDAAFVACRYVIDELKHRVPIWKKEFYQDHLPEWTRCAHSHGAHSH